MEQIIEAAYLTGFEPSSIRALLDDMDWYENKLKELSDKLDEYEN